MKMRVAYAVTGALRFIGHLDLVRALQRALRRSRLPVCYSQGFNPHILLTLAAPLAVGHEGLCEVMDVPLQREIAPERFLAELNGALPPLIRALKARPLPDDHPKPMAVLGAAGYLLEPVEQKDLLLAALPGYLNLPSIPAQRKGKAGVVDFDLRPLIFNLKPEGEGIQAWLALSQQGTCRPDLLLESLSRFAGLEAVPPCRVSRTGLYTKRLAPLFEA